MSTVENKICKGCDCNEFYMSKIEGYQGLCDACASFLMCVELEAQFDLELAIYHHRSGHLFESFNDFNQACHAGDVQQLHLSGLEELTLAYNDVEIQKQHENYENRLEAGYYNDLPF